MNLLLDVISPIPEFSVINDNKIILSNKIVNSEENKLSDSIIPAYQKIDKVLNLTRYLTSLIVTTGPGSYTSLRIGISFILGLHFSKEIKISGISGEDLLNFEINNNPKLNYGIYFISANNQEFVCYKLLNQNFKYIKLEKTNLNNHKELIQINIFYYNQEPLNICLQNCRQKKYLIKENILKNFSKLSFNNFDLLQPIYISNNQILNS